MTTRAQCPRARRPARRQVGQAQVRHEAGESGEQAEIHGHRRRLGTRRGASAAATFSELGYNVRCYCYQDSPRRAHSIAAQGGINAAKNYQNDGDSIQRLFYDTIKGGDFRSREANVYRLAQISVNIIDQCVAQGVPFAREYGGLLANRSFGGAQVSRTFYARGQTGQQLLLGAYQALEKEIAKGGVKMYPRAEMLDLIVVNGRARGIVVRDELTGTIEPHLADAVVLATGGYGNVFYLSTNAKGCNTTAIWRAYKRGAAFANPCYTQIHPTCIPVARRASVEADADVGVAAQRRPRLGAEAEGRRRQAARRRSPRRIATTTSSGSIRASATCRRATSRRAPPKEVCDEGRGVGPGRARRVSRLRRRHQAARRRQDSASATATCSRCTSASRTRIRTRCRCASTPPSTTRWAGSGWTTT